MIFLFLFFEMNYDNFKKKIDRENKLHNYDALDEKKKERVIQIDFEAENLLRMHSRCVMYSIKVYIYFLKYIILNSIQQLVY